MVKPRQFGPCGLYCGACGAADCGGCRSDLVDGSVRGCRFRKCAGSRSIEACCRCPECPCPPLAEFMGDQWPHHRTMKPNLDFIRERGIAAWLEAQEREWTCPACGAPTYWYQKKCPCGMILQSWELPG